MSPRTKSSVWSARQWRAVKSPIRMEILTLAEAEQPCSIADLARVSGRRATALYRHVRVLHEAGLLGASGKRPGKRRPEVLYTVTELGSSPRYDEATADGVEPWVRLQQAALRMTGRLIRDIFRGPDGRVRRPVDPASFHARHDVTWIDDARGRRLERLLGEITALIEDGRADRKGHPYQFSVMVVPRRNHASPRDDGAPRRRNARG